MSEIDSGRYWKIGLRIKTSFPLNNMRDGCVSLAASWTFLSI
jgi:hypothetical protein